MTTHYRVHTSDSAPAGAGQALQQLEAAVGIVPLANYAGHLTNAPLDGFLEPHGWRR